MTGYAFIVGVDGFGADTAPAYEEGIYIDYDKALAHLCELNQAAIQNCPFSFYEEGYGEDYYPETNIILAKAEEEEDWNTFDAEMKKHQITDIKTICETVLPDRYDAPPIGFYMMVEVNIY